MRKVMADTTAMLAHFRPGDQFTGFAGSSGLSQSTTMEPIGATRVSWLTWFEVEMARPNSTSCSFSSSEEVAGDGDEG